VPGISSSTGAGIFQGPVLQPVFAQSELPSVAEQLCPVRRDEVGERLALPHMVMEPQAAIHCVDHSFAAVIKLLNVEWVAQLRHDVPHTQDRVLLAGKLSLDDCWCDCWYTAHEHRARYRERQWVRYRRCPPTRSHCSPSDRGAGCKRYVEAGQVGRVRQVVVKIRFLRRGEVAQIGLQTSGARLTLCVPEVRNRKGGEDADDHDNN